MVVVKDSLLFESGVLLVEVDVVDSRLIPVATCSCVGLDCSVLQGIVAVVVVVKEEGTNAVVLWVRSSSPTTTPKERLVVHVVFLGFVMVVYYYS